MLMYFPALDEVTGQILALRMIPLRVRKMQLTRTSAADARWLQERVSRVSANFGCEVDPLADGSLALRWHGRAKRRPARAASPTTV